MIAEIRGTLTALDGDLATVFTAGGVGYEIAVPLGVLEQLPSPGHEVHLHTVLVVREDAWSLFGFASAADRAIFQRLLLANGVGPGLALSLVSALGPERVVQAIRTGDLGALCTVSGVGRKKAERMVLELKDRMGDLEVTIQPERPGAGGAQAVAALVNLGYPQTAAESAVRTALADHPDADTAALIRQALPHVAKS